MEITRPEARDRRLRAASPAIGNVANRSAVEQRRLVVFAVARKGDRVVAAGRAIVERLAPGKSAHFTAFLIGDPRGAELSAAAPPTVVSAVRTDRSDHAQHQRTGPSLHRAAARRRRASRARPAARRSPPTSATA